MSFIQIRLSQLAFGSVKKNELYKDATLKMIDTTLNTKQAQKAIQKVVRGRKVDKAVVMYGIRLSYIYERLLAAAVSPFPIFQETICIRPLRTQGDTIPSISITNSSQWAVRIFIVGESIGFLTPGRKPRR